MNKKISIILVILWAIVIFVFSSMPGKDSNDTSRKILVDVLEKTNIISESELTETKLNNENSLINVIHYYFRKSLHVGEYLILSILILNYLRFTKYKKNKIIISIILCFIYSVSDEIHQIYTFNRSPLFTDCLIDTSGAFIGCIIYYFIEKAINNRKCTR